MRQKSQEGDTLRGLLGRRRFGRFISAEEGKRRTKEMIARKRAERGLKSRLLYRLETVRGYSPDRPKCQRGAGCELCKVNEAT